MRPSGYRVIVGHLIKKAGFTRNEARTGAVTLIQRFGSAPNLNLHMLLRDGVYIVGARGTVERFRWVKAPTTTELTHTIAERVGRFLQRQGLLERDGEQSFLAMEAVDEGSMDQLIGHSIAYRSAAGPQAGRKVFTLQTLPASEEPLDDPVVSKKILTRLNTQDASAEPSRLPPCRAPPQAGLFRSSLPPVPHDQRRPRWARQRNARPDGRNRPVNRFGMRRFGGPGAAIQPIQQPIQPDIPSKSGLRARLTTGGYSRDPVKRAFMFPVLSRSC